MGGKLRIEKLDFKKYLPKRDLTFHLARNYVMAVIFHGLLYKSAREIFSLFYDTILRTNAHFVNFVFVLLTGGIRVPRHRSTADDFINELIFIKCPGAGRRHRLNF